MIKNIEYIKFIRKTLREISSGEVTDDIFLEHIVPKIYSGYGIYNLHDNKTILHNLYEVGFYKSLKKMCDNLKQDPPKDGKGSDIFWYLLTNNEYDLLYEIINYKYSGINEYCDKTRLIHAVLNKNIRLVKLFILLDDNINFIDKEGRNAIYYNITQEDYTTIDSDILNLLLIAGCDHLALDKNNRENILYGIDNEDVLIVLKENNKEIFLNAELDYKLNAIQRIKNKELTKSQQARTIKNTIEKKRKRGKDKETPTQSYGNEMKNTPFK